MESYNPHEVEKTIEEFWKKNDVVNLVRKKSLNSKGKKFYFLDGPPFPTGSPHPGTLANKVVKDLVLRYKRMMGYKVWDRPGWDMHGLPVENKAEKKLGLKDKKEIEKFGANKFIEVCKNFASENMENMTKDFQKLGVWMDWENPYMTTSPEYMEKVWWGVKEAWKNKLIYEGEKTISWCPHCATTLAKNELIYKERTDPSIFVKFKIKNKENEYLIIWTTTPWTLPFNIAVMANPNSDYVKIRVNNEYWILAKNLVEELMNKVKLNYEIVEEFKGKELKGLKYQHVFLKEVPWHQKEKNAYFVVLSKEFVDTTSGTGLVHCAPGCGPEDYIVGIKNKLPIFNDLNQYGEFGENSGEFEGLKAKKDDNIFIEKLRKKNLLVLEEKIKHEYPHCWRCDSPIVFRTTKQWFIAISKIRDKILKEIDKLYTVPKEAKQIFKDWISNFEDWCISLQRYWNTPMPIWKCEKCGHVEFIGSIKELEKKSGKKINDLHRPSVDNLTWKCGKCNGTMRRIPDVLTVWLDSGSAPWASLNEKEFKELFPADFITEGRDQIRAWFSALMNISMVALKRSPYKAFYWQGFLNDEQGRKMSKSLGNFIEIDEFLKDGVDPARITLLQWMKPGIDPNVNFKEITENKKYLNVLWNVARYIINYANFLNYFPDGKIKNYSELNISDKWIISRINSLIKETKERIEKYYISDIPKPIREFFVEDLSREYIQQIRKRVNEGDKKALDVLTYVFKKLLLLIAPITPYISEKIYQKLNKFNFNKISVHLEEFPKVDVKYINKNLEKDMEKVRETIRKLLAAREKAKINLRWPLLKAYVPKLKKELLYLIKEQTNIKELKTNLKEIKLKSKYKINYKKLKEKYSEKDIAQIIARIYELGEKIHEYVNEDKLEIKVNNKKIKLDKNLFDKTEEILPKNIVKYEDVYLFTDTNEELLAEGFTREIQRKVQELRKENKLNKSNKVDLSIECDNDLKEKITKNKDWFIKNTGINKLSFEKVKDKYKEFKIKDKSVKIKITKIYS